MKLGNKIFVQAVSLIALLVVPAGILLAQCAGGNFCNPLKFPTLQAFFEALLQHSTKNIIIPMQGKIDSMNVSVAAGILIFEVKRQRKFL